MIVVAVNTKAPIDNTALKLRGNLILGMVDKILAGRSECLPTVIDTVNNEMKAWCFAIEARKLTENEATFYRYISYIHTGLIEFDLTGELDYLSEINDGHELLENFCKNLYKPDLNDKPLYPDMMPVINRAEDEDIRDLVEDYIDTDSDFTDLVPQDFIDEEMLKEGMTKAVLNRRYGKGVN